MLTRFANGRDRGKNPLQVIPPSTFARWIPPRINWDHEKEGHAFPAFFRRIELPDWPGNSIRRPKFIGSADRATALNSTVSLFSVPPGARRLVPSAQHW